jgi:two-component system OmpR family response regulator
MAGHDLGAVDYLPKPISLAVLQKKVGNLLRLLTGSLPAPSSSSQIPHLDLDSHNLKATWHNQLLHLTVTEFEMIEQFAKQPIGSVVTYQQLQAATQGVVERNTINTHICRIRQAFKQITPEFDAIQNVYGRGYSWHEHD